MRKKISLLLISHGGSTVKQLTTSSGFLKAIAMASVAALLTLGYLGYDYNRLKGTEIVHQVIQERMADQSDVIASQRRQIQKFASEINGLKAKIEKLGQLEERIRALAKINSSESKEPMAGIGGPLPEDIDPRIEVSEAHDALMKEMHEQLHQLELITAYQRDAFQTLQDELEKQHNLLASTPAVWPTDGYVTSGFGYRKSPFTGTREFHKGLDIACSKGTPIIATADGVVSFTGRKGWLGKVIVIDHGHGLVTRYGHIEKALKKVGEPVKRGDTIALVGNSGRTTGPHVHYEVHLNGLPVNPKKYILN